MCLNMVRCIIDELFGKFTIKLTPKKFIKKLTTLGQVSEPHPHLIHTWITCDIIGTFVMQLVSL